MLSSERKFWTSAGIQPITGATPWLTNTAHIIHSVRNKIEPLKCIIKDNLDIILISETKLYSSFPTQQFDIDGFSTPFRLNRNSLGGGLPFYIREDITCKLLNKHTLEPNVEGIFIELNFSIIN